MYRSSSRTQHAESNNHYNNVIGDVISCTKEELFYSFEQMVCVCKVLYIYIYIYAMQPPQTLGVERDEKKKFAKKKTKPESVILSPANISRETFFFFFPYYLFRSWIVCVCVYYSHFFAWDHFFLLKLVNLKALLPSSFIYIYIA